MIPIPAISLTPCESVYYSDPQELNPTPTCTFKHQRTPQNTVDIAVSVVVLLSRGRRIIDRIAYLKRLKLVPQNYSLRNREISPSSDYYSSLKTKKPGKSPGLFKGEIKGLFDAIHVFYFDIEQRIILI